MTPPDIEDLLRELAPRVLGALLRRYGYGQFHLCEDATQEALLAAAVQWPADGKPDNPLGWLVTVATRKLLDQVRSEQSRRQREEKIAVATPQSELLARPPDADEHARDDSLILLLGCCHPAISTPSQIALTLRAIGGLSTAQIAAAFGVPEATMAQRISRARQVLKDEDFTLPANANDRLPQVLHVLYLIFNEGYTASEGDAITVPALSGEAIRLARWLHRLLPDDPEVTGLLALMLLTDARRAARTAADGVSLVPLAEQDRSRWDGAMIDEGTGLLTRALKAGQTGPYQLQAAIAAVHDEAKTMDDTDWPQILGLYDLLELAAPNPFTTLNRAVAVGMVHGPREGLELLATLQADKRMAKHHRLLAARAHLLELAGDLKAAADTYAQAARLSTNTPERRYLTTQAQRLTAQIRLISGTMSVESSWDEEYRRGRYGDGEPPVLFTEDILAAAGARDLRRGLYVGCGNGRNFLPLSRAGLILTGLDVSGVALAQLAARAPEYAGRLVHGDLGAIAGRFELVIGIQVFQHGDRATAHAAIETAQRLLEPGGLFCIRVNAVGSDLWPAHEYIEEAPDGGFTIRYLGGSKQGLLVHYFSELELGDLFREFETILAPRIHRNWREPPGPGQWSQWEAIWRLG